jgi:hypothetical protein
VNRSRAWSLLLASALFATAVRAQETLAVVGPEPAIVRFGDTALAEIRIVDPQGDPREFTVPAVDGLRVQLRGPSQLSEQSIIGGARTRRVTLTWQLEIQPLREGTFVIPPFAVWTGTKEQKTRELRLEVRKDLRGGELGWLDVSVEPRRVYVHEPIRIHVDAGVQPTLRLAQGRAVNGQGYYDVEVLASWLEDFPGGEPIEQPAPKGKTALIVRKGNTLFPVTYDVDRPHGNGTWLCFSFDRAFLPTRAGKIELAQPTLRFSVIKREGRRDVFGLSNGAETEQFFAYGKPVAIEVLPIPEKGRPTPYYGAVGRFTIDAALDRDTVKVNGSVKLTLTVRGEGNLEFLRLPPLDALDGFHKLGQAEAKRDADKVVVTYDLAPLSPAVRAVPAIEWNFFDTTPGVEAFVSVATKPLPLQVQPLADGETLAPLPANAPKAVTPGKDDIFDLPALGGAPVGVSRPAVWLAWSSALAPWLLAGALAWFVARHRRLRADVLGQRARRAMRACEHALAGGGDALDAFAGYLGDRLGVAAAAIIAPDLRERLVGAGFDGAHAAEIARLVDQGTAARYGGGAALTPQTVREQVQRIEGTRLRAHGWLPLLLSLLGAAAAGGSLRAQAPAPANDPVALYRAGDYRGADDAFASAYAASGDRRLLQARGNCLFRLDDLPRALWAYESARLALPRDPELLANIALVRQRLGLDDDAEGLLAQFERVCGHLTAAEQLALASACFVVAALCLVFGWRRAGLRWVGLLALLPGAWFAAEQLVFASAPAAIALQKLAIVAEPRAGLEPVATVRPGVAVALLGGSEGSFVRVRAGERSGYVPRAQIARIE